MDTNTCALESLIMGIVFADAKQQHELFVVEGVGLRIYFCISPTSNEIMNICFTIYDAFKPTVCQRTSYISDHDDDDGVMSVRFSTGTTMECLIKS